MKYEKLIKRLEKELTYKEDGPYFIEDIYKLFKDYSRQTTFDVLDEAIKQRKIKKYSRGIYYKENEPLIEEIIKKRYLIDEQGACGIYGRLIMELNFGISTQVPMVYQVITNKASRKYRELSINGQRIALYKSRCNITNKNFKTYSLLELFTNLDLNDYTKEVKENIRKYIKKENIRKKEIHELIPFFPAKTTKNLTITGAIYEAL